MRHGAAHALRLAVGGADVEKATQCGEGQGISAAVEDVHGLGRRGLPVLGDVTAPDNVRRMIDTAEAPGFPDVLVNRAGRDLGAHGADGGN